MFNVYVDFIITTIAFILIAMNATAAFVAATLTWEKWTATPPVAQKKAGRPEVGARAKRNLRLWMGWIDGEAAAQADFLTLAQFSDELDEAGLKNHRELLTQTKLSFFEFEDLVNSCLVNHRGSVWVDMNDLAHKLDLRAWKARNWF